MEIVEIERGETRTVEFKKELPQDSLKWIKTIVAFANGAGGKLLDPINDPINLFDLIKQNPSGSYEDYAQKLNVSTATIKRKISELKAEGKILRKGSNKNGFWETEK